MIYVCPLEQVSIHTNFVFLMVIDPVSMVLHVIELITYIYEEIQLVN